MQEKVGLLNTIWLCLLDSSLFLLGDGVSGRGDRTPSELMEKAERVVVEELDRAGEFVWVFKASA